ncbi:MAG TPA: SIS domain-containing protein [Candidatus Methanomethylophilaceae archaeon]|nr:SIS domain-containing protein [Candidatus Methanomethylophilaceae archaeon]
MDPALEYLSKKCLETASQVSSKDRKKLEDLITTNRKVFIYGSGRSGLVGELLAVRLVQLGIDVHLVGEMTTPIIDRCDLTILISNTGETASVINTANIAGRIGSYVVCITSDPRSKLAHASDMIILMKACDIKREYAPLGTIFEGSVILFFDSFIADLMKKFDCDETQMKSRHAIWV